MGSMGRVPMGQVLFPKSEHQPLTGHNVVSYPINSCDSVSRLINMEPLELLRLQPNEPIASESA